MKIYKKKTNKFYFRWMRVSRFISKIDNYNKSCKHKNKIWKVNSLILNNFN